MGLYIFITVLIIIVCVLLVLAVLVQNPKGGGLSASFGGMGNQVMGAKRSSDFIEKTTWTLVIVLFAFSLVSGFFMPKVGTTEKVKSEIEDKAKDSNFPFIPENNNQFPAVPDDAPQEQPEQEN